MEKKQKKGQPIRQDGPPSHLLTKIGTPTMGGILIIFSLISSSLIWSDLSNKFIWIILYSTMSFGALGFADDYIKIKNSSSDGINWKIKFLIQIKRGIHCLIRHHPIIQIHRQGFEDCCLGLQ